MTNEQEIPNVDTPTTAQRSSKSCGRPPKPISKLDATPEKTARTIFSSVNPPDPKRRVSKRSKAVAS